MPNKTTVNNVLEHVVSGGGRIVSLFTGLLAAFLILYSSYVLYDTFYIQNQAFGNTWDVLQFRPQIIDDGATPLSGGETLASINEDYRAWLTIYDTNIDYPVMQGENDLYYASHDIYKNSSLTGAIYLASGNSADFSDNYNLIYGHHMDNNAMFGGLDSYNDSSYFNAHREGVIVTRNTVYDLNIFAVVETDAYEDMVYNVGNRDLDELIQFIRENEVQFDASAVNGADKIVAFSTCESAETNGRRVVFATMTPRDMTNDDPEEPDDNPGGDNPGGVPEVVPGDDGNPGGGPGGTPGDGDNPGGDPDITPGENISDTTTIEDTETPLSRFIKQFQPAGGINGERAWALVNLICLILTILVLLPLHHTKSKVNRAKTMRSLNEGDAALRRSEAALTGNIPNSDVDGEEDIEELYQEKRFRRHVIIGFIIEIIISILAIVAFILTEDMRLPMVLIDKWTPLMLILLILCWVTDLILIRYRKKADDTADELDADAAAGAAK